MRDYCKQAQHLGDQRVDPFQACPHITVLLNPLSKGRKCRTQFDHYVAPILHCAGVRVSVFETESRGQAEQLMKVMANTDGVLIAGGDGTVHEAITGWLQRPEVERIGRSIAIAVLPLGKRNRTFNLLHDQSNKAAEEESSPFWQSSKVNEVRQLAECTLRVAKNERRQANVMQVQLSFDQSESTTLYALNALEFGQMSWLTTRFSKYWYLGQHLGEYYAMIRNTFWKVSFILLISLCFKFVYLLCNTCFVFSVEVFR